MSRTPSRSRRRSRASRRTADGVVRDAHGNRISPEAMAAGGASPKPAAAPREARPAPVRPFPVPREPDSGLRPAVALAAALVILIGGAYLILPPPPVAAAPARDEAATKKALYLGVLKIEAYRKLNGMVPFEIEVANVRAKDGYAYERLDDRAYVLTFAEPDGRSLRFDSRTPIEKFFGPPEAILVEGDGS